MNICQCLSTTAKLFPEKIAIVFDGEQWTYDQLEHKTQEAACWLSQQGVAAGDRVAIMLPNALSFPVWYYATLRIGAIAVSVSTRLAASEVAFVAEDCGATAFVASAAAMASVKAELPQITSVRLAVDDYGDPVYEELLQDNTTIESSFYDADPNEAALILYTSGTTGFPKGATLSHSNVRSNVHAFNHLCNMQSDDRVLLAVPLFHCFGQNALLNSVLNVGGTIVLQQRFDLAQSKQLIADHQITHLYGVPMMFGLLHESCDVKDLTSVNYCFSAAATLPIQTGEAWQAKFGLPIHEGYGLTETSPFATYNHRDKFVSGSIGTPIDCVEIKIVDPETGDERSTGEPGEIAIRGPNVMLGYWNRPKETATAIRDGWFHSGDIGQLDEAGYLYIVDRVKDMIAIGGLKVFPAEVERVLLDHPSVIEAAVIGVPDSVLGEQVIAYLVVAGSCEQTETLEQVQRLAKEHLGNYKVPRQLIAIESLPRNPSGKVLKTKLRAMFHEQVSGMTQAAGLAGDCPEGEPQTPSQIKPAGVHTTSVTKTDDNLTGGIATAIDAKPESSAVPLNTPASIGLKPATLRSSLSKTHRSEKQRVVTDFICQMAREICDLNELPTAESSFIEAGLDSLAMVSLSSQLQVEVGLTPELPPTLLFDHPRMSDLAAFIVEVIDGVNDKTIGKPSHNAASMAVPPTSLNPNPPSDRNQLSHLRNEVEQLSEADALAELMKELD
ncbi:AMP-binding protein [Mariniblastus sp.]|nr:AMP-binding protein [Mariniblastus sp.]